MADKKKSGNLSPYIYKGEFAVYEEGNLPTKMYVEIISRHQGYRLKTRPAGKVKVNDPDHRAALLYVSKDLSLPGLKYENKFSFEKFNIQEFLGGGTFGKVWKVVHEQTAVKYGMKQINTQMTHHSVDIYKERDFMFALTNKRICKILGSFFYRDPFILTELCACNALEIPRPTPLSDRIRYGIQLMEAVDFIHSKKIIHCDVKPGNVLISYSNNVKLTDFGSAVYLGQERCFKSPWRLTTHGYCNYKGIKKFESDYSTDIFGVACFLYEISTGNYFLLNENFEESDRIYMEAFTKGRLINYRKDSREEGHPREFLDVRAMKCPFGDVMQLMLPRDRKESPMSMTKMLQSKEMKKLKQVNKITDKNLDSEIEVTFRSLAPPEEFKFYGRFSEDYSLQETIFMTFYFDPDEKNFGFSGDCNQLSVPARCSKNMQTEKTVMAEVGVQTDETGAHAMEVETLENQPESQKQEVVTTEIQQENQHVSEVNREIEAESAKEVKEGESTGVNPKRAEEQSVGLGSSGMARNATKKSTGTNTAEGLELMLYGQEPAINVENFLFNIFLQQPEIKQIKISFENGDWKWLDIAKTLKDKWEASANPMAGGLSTLPNNPSRAVYSSEPRQTPQLHMVENYENPPSAIGILKNPPTTSSHRLGHIKGRKETEPSTRRQEKRLDEVLKKGTKYGKDKKDVDEKKNKVYPRRGGKKRRREPSESLSEPETAIKTPPIIKSRVVQDKKKKEPEKIKNNEKNVQGTGFQVTKRNKKAKADNKKDEEKCRETKVTQKNAKKSDASLQKRALRNAKPKPIYVVISEEEKDDDTDDWTDRDKSKTKIDEKKKIIRIAKNKKKPVTTGKEQKVQKEQQSSDEQDSSDSDEEENDGDIDNWTDRDKDKTKIDKNKKISKSAEKKKKSVTTRKREKVHKEQQSSDEEDSSNSDEDVNFDELTKKIREKYKDQLSSSDTDDSSSDESDE